MAVSLPTAADVRKVREQAARTAAERAERARTPLFAVLGAGAYAVNTVSRTVRAQAGDVQHRVAELPQRLSTDELRRAAADLREQAEQTYVGLAERGEQAWGRIRKQPRVSHAIATIESYTEKLDARVDDLVDDAHEAAEKALTSVTRQTRSTGEKAARSTQRVAADAAATVADAGAGVAENITETGDEVAHETRRTTRRVANRTAPKPVPPKPAARPPAE